MACVLFWGRLLLFSIRFVLKSTQVYAFPLRFASVEKRRREVRAGKERQSECVSDVIQEH